MLLIGVTQSFARNCDDLLNTRQIHLHFLISAVRLSQLFGMNLFLVFTTIGAVGELPIAPVAAVSFDVGVNAYQMLFVGFRALKLSLTELASVLRHFAVLQLMLAEGSTRVELQAALIALVAGRIVRVHVLGKCARSLVGFAAVLTNVAFEVGMGFAMFDQGVALCFGMEMTLN